MYPPKGESAPPLGREESHFLLGGKGAAFYLGYFIDFRMLTTKKKSSAFQAAIEFTPQQKSSLVATPVIVVVVVVITKIAAEFDGITALMECTGLHSATFVFPELSSSRYV